MNRRSLLKNTAVGLGGLSAGSIVFGQASQPASATVSMGQLSMSDDRITNDTGNIENVSATVSGSWQYELPGGTPTESTISLRVSDGDSWYTVAEKSESREYAQFNSEYSVGGSVTETSGFDVSYFAAPGPGKQTSVELPFEIWFRVNGENTQLASSRVSDTATVTVGQTTINASLYGELQGEGSVNVR